MSHILLLELSYNIQLFLFNFHRSLCHSFFDGTPLLDIFKLVLEFIAKVMLRELYFFVEKLKESLLYRLQLINSQCQLISVLANISLDKLDSIVFKLHEHLILSCCIFYLYSCQIIEYF